MYNEHTILMDVSGIAHRAFFGMNPINKQETPYAIYTRLFDLIMDLGFKYETNKFAFLFDGGSLLRYKIFPEYKMKRNERKQEKTLEEQEAYEVMKNELKKLGDHLNFIGFNNCFCQKGYEADDLFGVITKSDIFNKYIIVSSDGDLYQLITCTTSMFDPFHKNPDHTFGVHIDYNYFKNIYGINAEDWWKVKALAGCSTDEVPGIKSIGEQRAIDYLTGKMKKESKFYSLIESEESKQIYERNIQLVKLPMDGCSMVEFKKDCFNRTNFIELFQSYGISSYLTEEYMDRWRNFFLGKFNGVKDDLIKNRVKLKRC